MREFRTSGSVGAPGEQFPGATRLRSTATAGRGGPVRRIPGTAPARPR